LGCDAGVGIRYYLINCLKNNRLAACCFLLTSLHGSLSVNTGNVLWLFACFINGGKNSK
jgi:hypothetical protein